MIIRAIYSRPNKICKIHVSKALLAFTWQVYLYHMITEFYSK